MKTILLIFTLLILALTPVSAAQEYESFSFEKGNSASSIDFSEFDTTFSGDEKLSNWGLNYKRGWRSVKEFWPPVEAKLLATTIRIEKPGQFFYECLPGFGGEFTAGAGQFLNVSLGSVYCAQSFSNAIILNTTEPTENPYTSTLLRNYIVLGVSFEGQKWGLTFGYKTTNDQLNLEKSDLDGPNIIRYNNIEIEFHRRIF